MYDYNPLLYVIKAKSGARIQAKSLACLGDR